MYLAVDIGNSNIVLGIYKDNTWIRQFRYSSAEKLPDQFYLNGIQNLLLEWGIHPSDIKKVGLSSVVPHLTQRIKNILGQITVEPIFLLSPDLFIKMDWEIPLPYEIGSDLVSNAFAALKKINKPTIIIDFGTVLTFTVMHPKIGIQGVTFTPGIRTALKSLSGNTAQLPEADLQLPDTVIGQDTLHAMQSGVLYGYIGLVKEILERIQAELKEPYFILATGGMSSQLPLDDHIDQIDKQLTLDGIRFLHQAYQNE